MESDAVRKKKIVVGAAIGGGVLAAALVITLVIVFVIRGSKNKGVMKSVPAGVQVTVKNGGRIASSSEMDSYWGYCTTGCTSGLCEAQQTGDSYPLRLRAEGTDKFKLVSTGEDDHYYVQNASGEGRLVDSAETTPPDGTNGMFPVCWHSAPNSDLEKDTDAWYLFQVGVESWAIQNKKTGRWLVVCEDCDGETEMVMSAHFPLGSRPDISGSWDIVAA
jgi:hypothetical protein